MRKTSGSRSISSTSAWFSASRYVITAIALPLRPEIIEEDPPVLRSLGIRVPIQLRRIRLRRLVRELGRVLGHLPGPRIQRVQLVVVEQPVLLQPVDVDPDRVLLL